jgi:hypothetical protein
MPALIGLAGVLIGALVTAGVTYLGDRNHRIEENRTAQRLVANEIRGDVHDLLWIWDHGTVGKGHQTRTGQWLSEGPILARYVGESQWTKVSTFYNDLEYLEPSLPPKGCVTSNTWALGFTTAKEGDAALVALGKQPVPHGAGSPAPRLGQQTSKHCRSGL